MRDRTHRPVERQRRNTMATEKTTPSKKLHRATKIGMVKPLDQPAVPTPTTSTTPTETVSFSFGKTEYEY
jgi:hypothetical protein